MENANKASIHLRAEGIPSGKSAGSAREESINHASEPKISFKHETTNTK